MNLANQPGRQEGILGSAAGNPRPPITDFMAEMMMAPSQQPPGLASGAAQAAGPSAAAAAAESAAEGDCAAQGYG